MPRLNRAFESLVFFLYANSPKSGKFVGPLGTGFFVGVESGVPPYDVAHVYAVSCWHVISGQVGASNIRINTKAQENPKASNSRNTPNGKTRIIDFDPAEWQFKSNGDDLAIVDVTDRLNSTSDEISALPISWLVNKEFINTEELGIGEDGFMLGLFTNHTGKDRNLIAARFGNLSLLAQDNEPIEQPNGVSAGAIIPH